MLERVECDAVDAANDVRISNSRYHKLLGVNGALPQCEFSQLRRALGQIHPTLEPTASPAWRHLQSLLQCAEKEYLLVLRAPAARATNEKSAKSYMLAVRYSLSRVPTSWYQHVGVCHFCTFPRSILSTLALSGIMIWNAAELPLMIHRSSRCVSFVMASVEDATFTACA